MLTYTHLFAALVALLSCLLCCQAEDAYYTVDDKRNFDREFMHFGKRAANEDFGRAFMPFGKRADAYEDPSFNRAFMPFGKRSMTLEQLIAKKNINRDFMHFGKRLAPSAFDRQFMHFGKRR
ncbi:unnamed protein product [Bursaphelenchus okinawaensis]|uniref:Uncharacterized protein n=1 Tax=Bursaphelenchus okinawaensis TaxID=465554 RepID=A0A811L676_9BILA|nr:unnamed protein product [Bursaphelenchus okinawaensis]CAG9117371.1 unnamed protein product [Bursaphelenchus okinawaensis]